jgi:translation initiation factor 1
VPGCGRPVAHCICARLRAAQVAGDGRVRVGREIQGRGGKAVTVVRGLPLAAEELKALAKELKQRCGTGGTVKDGAIEIQATTATRSWPSSRPAASTPSARAADRRWSSWIPCGI